VIREYGEVGRSADKIVYSAGLEALERNAGRAPGLHPPYRMLAGDK
jgi:hypothetical protein